MRELICVQKEVETSRQQKEFIQVSHCSPSLRRWNSSRNYLFWKSPTSSCFTCFLELHDPYFNVRSNSLAKQSLSQNIQTSDGVHSQHKQMNILQTITSNGGALQVIQAQTVQKSSSRRAITSSTFSSQFCTTDNSPFSSGHRLSGDLSVRLINASL